MARYFFAFVGMAIMATMASADTSGRHGAATPRGLVGWWTGDDHANDIWGDNHGTLRNGTAFAVGKVGQAFSFDGVDDGVEIAYNPGLDLSKFTIDAWIKNTMSGEYQNIMMKNDFSRGDPWNDRNFGLFINQSGKLDTQFSSTAGCAGLESPQVVADDTWRHVAVTYDQVEIILYVDGRKVASKPFNGVPHTPRVKTYIAGGNRWWSFNGRIDEPEIYNRALTAPEVLSIYSAGSLGKSRLRPGAK